MRMKQWKREQTLENRLETSAVLIQAHSRGFLYRRRRWEEKQPTAVAAAVADTAPAAKVETPRDGDQWHEPEGITSSPNPRECDSVLPSERSISSDQTQYAGGYAGSEAGDSFFERRRSLPLEFEDRDDDQLAPLASEDANSDWQTNDTLFRADGTKNKICPR
ncbi:hypothetical protein PR002_g18825 [Phytophthora rubi]|uniref:Uncharacterized protein n=1 Tax=Phytophthora rubi TaxID=129364 RepID=A0A6A3K1D3_9STRA|nr:hypothetical protein PR002_g18825 [Phytophthora rubi]